MRHSIAFLMGLVTVFPSLSGMARTASAAAPEVYVDDSALEGGDGSAVWPVRTIQEGIALLPRRGGTVWVYPGTYVGPILVERDDVVLWGLVNPIYDAEGFLAGFWSEDPLDDEVVITIDRPLFGGDPTIPIEPEDLVELRGSGNEVHNVVVDLRGHPSHSDVSSEASALSAKAEDADFYDDIVFSHIIARGWMATVGWTRKANVLFEYITALDPGYIGINPTANGHAELRNVHLASKNLALLFLGLWERPRGENGAGLLTGVVADSKLRDASASQGDPPDGAGIVVHPRAGQVNPEEPTTIILDVTGNTFDRNRAGIVVRADTAPPEGGDYDIFVSLRLSGNTYVGNRQTDADVQFQGVYNRRFATNATVVVEDGDGVFPDPADVDLGPEENGNSYELITP